MYKEIQEVGLTSLVKNILLATLVMTLFILLSSIGYEVLVKENSQLNSKLIFTTVLISLLTFIVYAHFPKIRMITQVDRDFIDVKIGFLIHKHYSRKKVIEVSDVEFQPISDFGGYGYRTNTSKNTLIASGNQGVELLFEDKSIVILGTKNPKDLLEVLVN